MNYDLDFLRRMQGAPAEAADEIERLRAEIRGLNDYADMLATKLSACQADRNDLLRYHDIANQLQLEKDQLVDQLHMTQESERWHHQRLAELEGKATRNR